MVRENFILLIYTTTVPRLLFQHVQRSQKYPASPPEKGFCTSTGSALNICTLTSWVYSCCSPAFTSSASYSSNVEANSSPSTELHYLYRLVFKIHRICFIITNTILYNSLLLSLCLLFYQFKKSVLNIMEKIEIL